MMYTWCDSQLTICLDPTRLRPPSPPRFREQVRAELTEQADQLRSELSELRQQLQQLTAENEQLHAQSADAQTKVPVHSSVRRAATFPENPLPAPHRHHQVENIYQYFYRKP